jgi:hypothetical protein
MMGRYSGVDGATKLIEEPEIATPLRPTEQVLPARAAPAATTKLHAMKAFTNVCMQTLDFQCFDVHSTIYVGTPLRML